MYQPTTRLLTVLELLQARGRMSGPELAERLEVDRRSIRRYVTMLQDLGVPVEGMRGAAGGYRLRPGYKLPPLMFTDQEAVALTLALIAAPRLGLAVDPAAANGALAKIERVLPQSARDRVQAVQSVIAMGPDVPISSAESDVVALLSHAANVRQSVVLRYNSGRGQLTERRIDPYGVVNVGRRWYVAGHCHLREERRVFRIDRIETAQTLDGRFAFPDGIDVVEMVLQSIASIPGEFQAEVLLKTTFEAASRRMSFGYGRIEAVEDGVLYRCQLDDMDHLARFLVGMGFPFEVRKPVELVSAVRRLGEELTRMSGQDVVAHA